ncbi:MAG: endonuclease III [Bacteroidaceae bacterium]|nr:endonuclease III [Bacteroidaceae bacterium]
MTKKELYKEFIAYFEKTMPVVETELHYGNPFELLTAVILSAQCTDKRVNMVTPALFEAMPTPQIMAEATPDAIYEYIKSISYPNNKAKHLHGMANMLVGEFDGEVPSDIDKLMKLPGVGRKTANVIQAVIFSKATMAVDTHVFRVSHRIGLVSDKCTTPYSVEMELTKNIPDDIIPKAHHWLILHGRYTCMARKPLCDKCGLKMLCKHYKTEFKVRKTE